MRKVDDGKRKRKKKIMSFLVATNVVASRLPKRRLTGTPHACAKIVDQTDLHPPRSPCRTRIKCEDGYIPAN